MKELILPKDYKSESRYTARNQDRQRFLSGPARTETESYPRICTAFRRSGNRS